MELADVHAMYSKARDLRRRSLRHHIIGDDLFEEAERLEWAAAAAAAKDRVVRPAPATDERGIPPQK